MAQTEQSRFAELFAAEGKIEFGEAARARVKVNHMATLQSPRATREG